MTTIRFTDKPHHFKLILFLQKLGVRTPVNLLDDRPLVFKSVTYDMKDLVLWPKIKSDITYKYD